MWIFIVIVQQLIAWIALREAFKVEKIEGKSDVGIAIVTHLGAFIPLLGAIIPLFLLGYVFFTVNSNEKARGWIKKLYKIKD